jgi:hypothetical protein
MSDIQHSLSGLLHLVDLGRQRAQQRLQPTQRLGNQRHALLAHSRQRLAQQPGLQSTA